jgi:hypothetical protein
MEWRPPIGPATTPARSGPNSARLAWKEAPWPPYPEAFEAIGRAAQPLDGYPDMSFRALVSAIADYAGSRSTEGGRRGCRLRGVPTQRRGGNRWWQPRRKSASQQTMARPSQGQDAGFESPFPRPRPDRSACRFASTNHSHLSIPREISVLEDPLPASMRHLVVQWVFFNTRAIKSSSLERNSFRIGDGFILL